MSAAFDAAVAPTNLVNKKKINKFKNDNININIIYVYLKKKYWTSSLIVYIYTTKRYYYYYLLWFYFNLKVIFESLLIYIDLLDQNRIKKKMKRKEIK